MGYTPVPRFAPSEVRRPVKQRLWLHALLFALTFFSVLLAGVQWMGRDPLELSNLHYGLTYAVLILCFLSAHEFGHYFAARFHRVEVTLPYFLPVPLPFFFPFGTLGAVIRTLSPIPSRRVLFDIGIAGPLAGFVVSIGILIIGFQTLPSKEYLYAIHPEYVQLDMLPQWGLHFGDIPLYHWLASVFASPEGFLPPMNEMYHYPFLCVGWFGLFVTMLNLLPLGQLDGGHITYALFGRFHIVVARTVWWLLVLLGMGPLLGWFAGVLATDSPNMLIQFLQQTLLPLLRWVEGVAPWYFQAWEGWLVWALLTRLLIRLEHPSVPELEPLTPGRRALGWIALVVFALCFSYNGIYDLPSPTGFLPAR
ncbi:MAG: site-2 protease family protein [Candidatus Kapabacteria bacterium]|nr:site-2 protease family protein [Candidatus Kapabacteria bacterium]MCS7168999.1 site-2 protease family protein [Candidatus Kapabacteria bacterium]MDW7997203.1 site-2 protease family protein [Bacteroidota bacterium]MDW8224767.1 site-2 protease family protein [Bacteroidota bacterium]